MRGSHFWSHLSIWSGDQRDVTWKAEKTISSLSRGLLPLNLTGCWLLGVDSARKCLSCHTITWNLVWTIIGSSLLKKLFTLPNTYDEAFLENSQQLKTIIHFHKKVPSEMIDTVWNTFLVSIPFGFYLHFYYSDKVLHWLRCFFQIYLKFPPMNSHFNQIYWLCFRKGLSQVQLICLCNHQLKYRFHYFSSLFVISSYIVVAG